MKSTSIVGIIERPGGSERFSQLIIDKNSKTSRFSLQRENLCPLNTASKICHVPRTYGCESSVIEYSQGPLFTEVLRKLYSRTGLLLCVTSSLEVYGSSSHEVQLLCPTAWFVPVADCLYDYF